MMMKKMNIYRPMILLVVIGAVALGLTACKSEPILTKDQQKEVAEQRAKEKQIMYEKKLLSDFQNKAYKIYTIKDISKLTSLMDESITKLNADNAVKMVLNFELSQRMALENDGNYGAVSSALSAQIYQEKGMVDLNQINASTPEVAKEIKMISDSWYGVYKDTNGAYCVVDYTKLQKYKPYLSDEFSRYIDYMTLESTTPSIKDKRIQVSKDEIWVRLHMLDTFFTDYPVPSDALIRNNLGRYYQDLLVHAIYGDDLDPNFDPVTGFVKPEALARLNAQIFAANSEMATPFANFKNQLTTDQGMLTPAVSTHIQQLVRISKEVLTDHID